MRNLSTGGYELLATSCLAEAGLAVVIVNQRQVRNFAKATGILAKTDAIDARVLLQERHDRSRVLLMAVHPHREGLRAAQDEETVHRPGDPARRVLDVGEPIGPLFVARHDGAADDIGVPAEVLRHRVQDEIGAERERLLQVRRREGVVDHDLDVASLAQIDDRRDVDNLEERIGRALEPDDLRPIGDCGRDLLRVGRIDEGRSDPEGLVVLQYI